MDVLTIERDFTAFMAEQLNLTVDDGIYRGGIPVGATDGVAVIFGSEVKAPGFYGFRPRTWNVQILGKYADRDTALILLTKLNGIFPLPGFAFGNTAFLSALQRSSAEPYQAADAGEIKTFISYNLVLTVLTSGTQA